jgi:hypothetical protein
MKIILLTAICLGAFWASAQLPDSAYSDKNTPLIATNIATAKILQSQLDDANAFHVTLRLMLNGETVGTYLGNHNSSDNGYEDVVLGLNADGKTATYGAKTRYGSEKLKPLTIDFSNKQEIAALINLFTAYNRLAVGQPCASFFRVGGDGLTGGTEIRLFNNVQNQAFISARQAYHGAFGECVGLTEDYGALRQLPDLRFRSSAGQEFGLPQPLTLLYIIAHQSEFWQMRDAAIAKRDEAKVAAKKQAETAANAEIENAKAESAARVKAAEEAASAEIAKLNQQKKLDAVTEDESAQIKALQEKVLDAKIQKISIFLNTKEGTSLKNQIQAKIQEIHDMQSKTQTINGGFTVEDVTADGARVTLIMGNEDYFIYGLKGVYSGRLYLSQLFVKAAPDFTYTTVMGTSRTIPGFELAADTVKLQLAEKRKDLNELLKQFEQSCGVSYDEAVTILQTSQKSQ